MTDKPNPEQPPTKPDSPRSLLRTCWDYKWWWLAPMLLVAAFYLFLLASTDMIGDSPFQYILR